MPIQRRKRFFLIVISLLVLSGFVITSLIGYYVAKDSISSQLREEMLPLTSDNIYSEIQRDLLTPLLISSLMANDTFLREWVEQGEQEAERISNYLEQIQRKYNTITAFFVSDKTMNYYHPSGILKQLDEGDAADRWYFRSRALRDDYEINIDLDTADRSRLSIFVNYQVKDERGRLIGVTGVGLSMEAVGQLIESYQRRYGRQIYFVDRQGEVTLHGESFDEQLHLQNREGLQKLFTRILTSPSASVEFQAEDGRTIYLNSRLVPEFDWYLVVEQVGYPDSQKVESALIFNLLLSLVICVVVLLIAHFTLRGHQRRLEDMATRDKLTGVISRQVFEEVYERAAKDAQRREQPLSLILLDIDHFKKINDDFGHHLGDEVLVGFANLTQRHIRREDVLCRWGGEEFLVLLENCDIERATEIANQLREQVKHHAFHSSQQSLQITISAGVAQLQPGESMSMLLRRCDKALYQAKNEGRDRVISI